MQKIDIRQKALQKQLFIFLHLTRHAALSYLLAHVKFLHYAKFMHFDALQHFSLSAILFFLHKCLQCKK